MNNKIHEPRQAGGGCFARRGRGVGGRGWVPRGAGMVSTPLRYNKVIMCVQNLYW